MAAYDFDSIRTVIQALGYGTDSQSVAVENQAITATWLELAAEREWSFLLKRNTSNALTIGSETVPLPTDLVVPKAVTLAEGTIATYLLDQISADEMQQRLDLDATPTPAAQGVPLYWAWVKNSVKVWPRPQAAYTVWIDYVKAPDPGDFDANNEALPFLDSRFPLVIAWGAARYLAFRQRDQVSYGIAKGEYESAKQNFSQSDRRGEPGRVVEA
jgi:hypothetical protein